jgi:uncharacterized Zn-binding protein involved in type VI secretion
MGKPAARLTDMHMCPMVTPGVPPIPHVGGPITGPGAPTVLIGGMPAAVMGDMCVCTGPPDSIIMGSLGVFIGDKPAARMGDPTAHGGMIAIGCPTVLIGDIMPGSPASPVVPLPILVAMQQMGASNASKADQLLTMKAAAKKGMPFCEKCEAAKMKGTSSNSPGSGAGLVKWIKDKLTTKEKSIPINQNKSFLITPPDKDLVGQKKNDTCAMASIAMAIKKISGTDLTEDQVIAESKKYKGGYQPGKGTFTNSLKPTIDGLAVQGVTTTSKFYEEKKELFDELNSGKKMVAVVHVNNEHYFGGSGGHFVTVTGVTKDLWGNKYYYIDDPWGEPPPEPAGNGKNLKVPAKDFENAMSGYATILEK